MRIERTCLVGALALASAFAAKGEIVLRGERTEVVVAKSAKTLRSAAWFAAEEMTNFLSRALGHAIPIAFAPHEDRTSIVLGTNAWSAAAGIDLTGVPRDGSVTRTVGGRIYIAGADGNGFDFRVKGRCLRVEHGTLNGVYDFLERQVGCRFYFPGELGEIVPRHERLVVPEIDRLDRPDYLVRESTHRLGEWPDEFTEQDRKNGLVLFLLRLRYETQHIPCCHGQSLSGFSRRFGKTHPEYFLLRKDETRQIGDPERQKNPDDHVNTEVCNSSAIWDEIYKDAKSYFSGEGPEVRGMVVQNGKKFTWGPQARGGYYDVMPNDGMHPCFCAACQAAYAKAKDPADYADELVWGRVVGIANRLKAEGVKGTLTMMAYPFYRNVPDIEIPDNVAVMVCGIGPWTRGKAQESSLENLRQWVAKRKGKVWLWQNTGRYGSMIRKSADVPSPTPRTFGRHYREIAPYVFGAYCSNNSPRFLYSAINYYVYYKVSWDNATDADALVDEYNRLMFGPAAKPMGEFLDLLEQKWITEVMGNVSVTSLGELPVSPSEYQFWAKIYTLDFVRRLAKLVDAAEKAVVPGSLEARRVAMFRRELLTPMFPHAEQYEGGGSVRREKARRAAAPCPTLVKGDFKPVTIEVTPDMTNSINHGVGYQLALQPGRRYRLSYFVRCHDVKLVHRWGGVDAVVWADGVKDGTLLILGGGLCGTTDWICMRGEFSTPADMDVASANPRLSLRVSRAIGKADYDGLLVEEVLP